jgi:hypothetical protein
MFVAMDNSVAPVKPASVEAVLKYQVEPLLRIFSAIQLVLTAAVLSTRVDDVPAARVR